MSRVLDGAVERDELVSAGYRGLFRAARRFDPKRKVPFRIYAHFRVTGAMLDAARELTGAPRPGRRPRTAYPHAMTLAHQDHEERRLEVPVDERELDDLLADLVTSSALSSMTHDESADDRPTEETIESPESLVMRGEILAIVNQILGEMPPREARIIRYRYLHGQSTDRIALSMGVDRSWVTRLHGRALRRLTKMLRLRL